MLGRFPGAAAISEALKPLVLDVLQLSMKVLYGDNEDNAMIAQRVIFELHKSFRPNLESQVQVHLLLL